MQWVDCRRVALLLAGLTVVQHPIAAPDYGKVETFEPGKKYSCVPSADHKSWNCMSQDDAKSVPATSPPAAEAQRAAPTGPATPAAAPENESVPSTASDLSTPQPKPTALPGWLKAQPSSTPDSAPPPPPEPAAAAPPQETTPLQVATPTPSPAARTHEPAPTPAQEASAAPVTPPAQAEPSPAPSHETPAAAVTAPPTPPAAEPVLAPPQARESAPTPPAATPAPEPRPTRAATPAVAPPVVAPAPAQTSGETSSSQPTAASIRGNHDFLSLPASHYVIELAHGQNRGDYAALRDTLQLPRGELYELHLQRDGGDWWVLVWASFDGVDAARAARSELPADAPLTGAWPRPVAPLQAEVRRVSSN